MVGLAGLWSLVGTRDIVGLGTALDTVAFVGWLLAVAGLGFGLGQVR
jgi:hypothetical protein